MALFKNSREFFFQGTPPCFEKIDPLWQKKKWTPSHGLKELAHLWYAIFKADFKYTRDLSDRLNNHEQ